MRDILNDTEYIVTVPKNHAFRRSSGGGYSDVGWEGHEGVAWTAKDFG